MPVAFKLIFTIDRPAAQAVAMATALQVVTDVTRRVFNRAIVLTPVRTGNLRAQNQMRVLRTSSTEVTGEVFNDTSYAAAVHNGNRAYVVRPVRRKALRWVSKGGDVVFARSARIPARRGRPWLYRALVEVAGPAGFAVSQQP